MCRLTTALRAVCCAPGFVTMRVPPPPVPPPLRTIAWVNSHVPPALPVPLTQSGCIANVPVVSLRLAVLAPGPVFHWHRSAVSSPLASVPPPGGFWSVMVSAYSWPLTIDTPSSRPALPELTKFLPHARPASVIYGRFENATWPYDDDAGPPGSVESPFQSCQPQKSPDGVLNPSGWVPAGDRMTYCAFLFDAAVVLPKWAAAATASAPSRCPVARLGAAMLSS